MFIDSIIIHNYRAYKGHNKILFKPDKKNIFLIARLPTMENVCMSQQKHLYACNNYYILSGIILLIVSILYPKWYN